MAFIVPLPEGTCLTEGFVRRCLGHLAGQGFQRVITGALSPEEQPGFLEAGFTVHERLQLLLLDTTAAPAPVPPGPRLHLAGPWRRRGLLEVDARAFAPFWRLDQTGLREALNATRKRRLRVALGPGRQVSAYAICGAAGGRGFVQRLAVAPEAQHQGLGRRLLLDGVHWLRSVGVAVVAVNTQQDNHAALSLYRRAGFRDDPRGLAVLAFDLVPAPARALGP